MNQVSAQAQERLLSKLLAMGLPRAASAALLQRHMVVRYPKGAELFAKGSPADVVFAVLSGVVKVHGCRPGSDPVLLELAGPGDLVGYADFADTGGERSQLFDATALSNCCVALFTRHHIMAVLKTLEIDALLRFTESINSMWSAVAYRYASFLGMSLRQRLEVVLAELAERFGVPDARGTLLLPELAQEELAQMIGSSRPMVSKLVTEMTENGVLLKQGRRHILVTPKSFASRPAERAANPRQAPAESERIRADRRAIRTGGATAAII